MATPEDSEAVRLQFVELQKHVIAENFPRIISVADQILAELPGDGHALACKITALLHLNKFPDALKTIEASGEARESFVFENVYCLFRTQQLEEALALAQSVQEPSFRIQELQAQILYRLERFGECTRLYQSLIAESTDDFEAERHTNLAAAFAGAATQDPDSELVCNAPAVARGTYELSYNEACFELARGRVSASIAALTTASEQCRETLQEEGDLTEEDIEAELALMKVQLGVAHQRHGDADKAMALYTRVLKTKPDDISLAAVASNNIVALNKDHDVFDSRKKVKAATSEAVRQRLTSVQRQTVDFNQCLLLMYSNQGDACRKRCKELQATYPSSETPCLIQAALLLREKKSRQSIKCLQDFVDRNGSKAEQPQLVIAQTLISDGDLAGALAALGGLAADLRHRPALVGLAVRLHLELGDPAAAATALDDAVAHWQQTGDSLNSQTLLREGGKFKLDNGLYQGAVASFRRLADADGREDRAVAQLVVALSHVDLAEAERVAELLPPPVEVDEANAAADVDALEAAPVVARDRLQRRAAPADGGDDGHKVFTKRKRKKRPGKPPKDYNPKVKPDPERWLPRYLRSSFRGRKLKKKMAAVGKGSQGAASMTQAEIDSLDQSLKPDKEVAAKPSPVKAAKKKKNKRGGKGGRR